ncbi:CDP-diacylglycerol--glycerol-3-phosphate 3-phosphatidyltransferase [Egibacter rhizosphaerae]|uniref:CDP-diacylglycerol--glycerol-3-phosphate 3-phosphatidyltransferase n=1 Tax=Egibacter rhizosphaerae TaxID=1670831 RepID=UPI0013F1681D|nr:CDP-diacylglycerol--glycerol-3-phosphate 3-phosphatidyltransferase [Egibacter rhizosphaerae]
MRARGAVVALTQLTVARIVAVPLIMALLLVGPDNPTMRWSAFGLFVAAAVTDFLDGYLARRWQVTSDLGSFLDTTADKLLTAGVLIALVEIGRAWSWIVVIIVARELVVMGLRGLVASTGAVMPPSVWGKLKTNVQFIAIALAIVRPGEAFVAGLYADEVVMLVAGFVTFMSGAEYLVRFRWLFRLDAGPGDEDDTSSGSRQHHDGGES